MSLPGVTTGYTFEPMKTMVYGVHGIGKSTFGSLADNPIFIQTEEGLGHINCSKFPLAKTFAEVKTAISSVASKSSDHDYRTLVIDSLDWLERLIWKEVCGAANVTSIERIGYAKGYVFAMEYWNKILVLLEQCRENREMDIILVAHSQIKRFNDPTGDGYDRYKPKIHDHISSVIMEWCDNVLFANYKVYRKESEKAFGGKEIKGVGEGERRLFTEERPSFNAKNRLYLQPEMNLDYDLFAQARNRFIVDGDKFNNQSITVGEK